MNCIRHVAVVLALVSAIGCSTSISSRSPEPAPAARRGPSTASTLGIPPGHLPAPGMCRVWVPGKPPGHQARPRSCEGIERAAPAGSWIVYRPGRDRKVVHVREVDRRRAGVIVRLRVYDAQRGTLIREG